MNRQIVTCLKCRATYPSTETVCPSCDTPRSADSPVSVVDTNRSLITSLSEMEDTPDDPEQASHATTKKKVSPSALEESSPTAEKATVIRADQSPRAVHTSNSRAIPSAVKPGDVVLKQYRLVSQIGAGGMGAVFLAKDDVSGQEVAIKCLPANAAQDAEMLERFTQEARALAALDHKNIVPLIRYSVENEDRYLVMKYVKGESVDELIKKHRQLPFSQIEDIMRALLEALGYAHQNGVIHRDVKPANVLITLDNKIYLVDFGIAKREEDMNLTQTGNLVGTPLYMSPEQITGKELDGRSDLYAAGILLYEMITGQHPYAGKTPFAILRAHVENPPPNPVFFRDAPIPPHIDYLLQCLLEKSREQRPRSAEAALALCDQKEESGRMGIARNADYYADRSTPATSFLGPDELSPPPSKQRNRSSLLLMVASAILLLAGLWIYNDQQTANLLDETSRESIESANQEAAETSRVNLLVEEARLKLEENDVKNAIALLRIVSTKENVSPKAESLLLDIYLDQGAYKKAKRAFNRLDKLDSLPPEIGVQLNEQRNRLALLQETNRKKRRGKRDRSSPQIKKRAAVGPTQNTASAAQAKDSAAPPDGLQQGSPNQVSDEGLSYQQIQSVTGNAANKQMLSECWSNNVLVKDRYARGNVRLVLTIQNDGHVLKSRVEKENIGHPDFLNCIRKKSKTWIFPTFKGPPEEVDYMAAFQGELPPTGRE